MTICNIKPRKGQFALEILAVCSIAGTILAEGNVPNKIAVFPLLPISVAILYLKSPMESFHKAFNNFPTIAKLLALLVPVNEFLRSLDGAGTILGALNATFAVRLLAIILSFVILSVIDFESGKPRSLYILGASSLVITTANLVAYKFDYNLGGLRTDVEHTSYSTGTRLVTMITPGWYLSGELRWALPLLLLVSFERWVPIWMKIVSWAAAPIFVYVVMELGYRGAIFCVAFAGVWYIAARSHLREMWSKAALIYYLAVPFVWTAPLFERAIPDLIPQWVYNSSIIGRQEVASVLELSGRTAIWRQGIDALFEGSCLIVGNGLSFTKNLEIIGEPQFTNDSRQGTTLPLHQGFLEWVFAYGLLPAIIITIGVAIAILQLPKPARQNQNQTGLTNRDITLLSLGLCAVANSQDGFFVLDQFFWLVLIATIVAGYLGQSSNSTNEKCVR